MADIHIVREHGLDFTRARKLALRWAEVAERKLELECSYEEGRSADVVHFRRQGAHGELKVTKDHFELDARLGLLLGVFKHQIETEIVRNLDELLAHEDPLHAFDHRVAKHDAKHGPSKSRSARSSHSSTQKPQKETRKPQKRH